MNEKIALNNMLMCEPFPPSAIFFERNEGFKRQKQ